MMEMNHYKDQIALKKQSRHFADTMLKEKGYLERIAEKCKEAYKTGMIEEKVLYDFLVDPHATNGSEHKPDHSFCPGFPDSKRAGGEKQICHCMFYYNSDFPKDCNNCKLSHWKNVGVIQIVEFEYPAKYDIPGIGGIDLVLNYKNVIYGAEVKPPNSNETVSRMVSEILTYSVVDRLIEFEPAIAVFRNSNQYNTIVELEKNENAAWLEIKKHVSVFVIDYEEKGECKEFLIVPYNE